MRIFSFRGGVHPPYAKNLSMADAIKISVVPESLTVPLSQHIGAPCGSLVKTGDSVKEGQVIGKATGFVTSPIHSPVSGKVTRIEARLHPLGSQVTSIIIEKDESNDKDYLPPMGDNPDALDADALKQRVSDAGIVGLGGATFPTHVKLSPPPNKKIDTLIINGCECEPYLTADYRIMLEQTEDLITGARIIGKILKVDRIIIAVENNKPEAIEKLSGLQQDGVYTRMVTATKYPQGAEKVLIKALLDKEVPSGGLPMDVGVIVSNVGTAVAVCEAVRDGKPLIERVVTVTGDGINKPGNFRAKIGTPMRTLIEEAGGAADDIGKIIMGGPMMGIAQMSVEVPVIKGTSGILVLKNTPSMEDVYLPCIKCSLCIQACPASLMPTTLSIIAEAKKWELAEKYGVSDCFECGSCAYVCPSKRPIVQFIKTTKAKLRDIKAKEK